MMILRHSSGRLPCHAVTSSRGAEVPPAAGYLYGLAVHPRARGRTVGAKLLAWAEEHVRQQERIYLRLNCVASNAKLRRYYEARGYHLHGLASTFNLDRALYEKQL